MLKKINYFILLWVISSLFVAIPAYADAADDDSSLEDSMTFHVYDDVDLVSTLKFEYGKPKIIIKSVYPKLASETPHDGVNNFNDAALQIVRDEITRFRNLVKNNASAQKKMAKNSITNNLYIDYNTSFIKPGQDHVISIRFSIQGVVGKSSPYHDHIALNYDLDKSRRIELSELFLPGSNYLSVLSDYTQAALNRQLANKSKIADGTAPRPENFQNWNIKPNGLLITFNENQAAPSIYGAQTILVPYSALSHILSPDSPVAGCIKNRTKCIRYNLLTGGFIDEAAKAPRINNLSYG